MKELVYHRTFMPAVEEHASLEAFHDGEYHSTFETHADRTFRLCHALGSELGIGTTDRFAVMALNSHEYLELYHAAFLGTGVINPLNLRLAGKELQHIIRDSGTEVVFVDPFFADHFANNVAPVREELNIRHLVLVGDGDLGPCDMRYDELIDAASPVVPDEPEEDDPVVLMYTGGTTGLPKGVLLDHRAEILNLYHVAMLLGFEEGRVYLHQTPMFHAASMGGVLAIPASAGVSVFIPMFDPGGVLDLIEQYRVNQTVMVPTMINMVMSHDAYTPERLESLTHLTYGASPMPAALLERVLAELPNVEISQGYGMTEASAILTWLPPEDHRTGGAILRSAGRAAPGVALTIQDSDGNILPSGSEGEVCARAGNLMREYWNNPSATAEAFRGGWYHTGDAGYLDPDGYLYLVDRVKDMIVTGGENVYSIEVENALSSHEAVDQVAVIGIPDEKWGEAVHAIVVLKAGATATEAELMDWTRESIAGYKVPKSIEFREEPLPLSGALKVLKKDLRAPYWEGHDRGVN
jgi:long-chain acyl-CoA synthetase